MMANIKRVNCNPRGLSTINEIPVTKIARLNPEIVSKELWSFGHLRAPTKSCTVDSQQQDIAPYPSPATTQPIENESWLSALDKTVKFK